VVDLFTAKHGGRLLKEIKTRDIQEYLDDRASKTKKNGKRLSPGTVDRERIILSAIFTKAVEWEFLLKNPVKPIKKIKWESKKERVLTTDEEVRLFRALDPPEGASKDLCARYRRITYLKGVTKVALNTGMREGEILRTRWRDADFEGMRIRVLSTNENPTKSKKTRWIPMNRTLSAMLAQVTQLRTPAMRYLLRTEMALLRAEKVCTTFVDSEIRALLSASPVAFTRVHTLNCVTTASPASEGTYGLG
jgi:integrase